MRLTLFLEIDLSNARANLSHTDVAQRLCFYKVKVN